MNNKLSYFEGGESPSIKYTTRKSVMGPIISVFVMVLIVAILAGITFLFVSSLKTNVYTSSARETVTVTNESGTINSTGYTLSKASEFSFENPAIVTIVNSTAGSGATIASANYTLSSSGVLTNKTAVQWNNVGVTYTYVRIANANAYNNVNSTEASGATVVNYLPLVFLAVIFGALLTLVLRLILPYVNLGQSLGGGF